MPDRRDWLVIAGGIVFIVLVFWVLPQYTCSTNWVLAGPLKTVLGC